MNSKRIRTFFLAACLTLPLFAQGRLTIDIPDIQGYMTLKCDFHTHTVFSDGSVYPTVRIDEAYRDGLDVIAITDHIEIRPYKDIVGSHNRAYEIARDAAKSKGIILIKGSEITRQMPPGHHNALFLTNSDELDTPDYMDAFRAARAQGAFIFWNHPGEHQPDTIRWWAEHAKLYEQGLMQGIEIVNRDVYYPEAHRWCLEKKLTMLGNSDIHPPMESSPVGKHRPMTLVFARSATPEAIHEALKERRTAVYFEEFIIGEEIYLKELFENALEWSIKRSGNQATVTVTNKSDLTFRLKKTSHDPRLVYFRNSIKPFTIEPKGTHSFSVKLLEGIPEGDVNFSVENFLVEPNKGMNYTIKLGN